jgi:hypothetical protein
VSLLARRRATAWTGAAVVLAGGLLAAVGMGGWPGDGNGCRELMRPACFCEQPRPAGVAQPANTWSNLAFVAVGLAIAIQHDRVRRRGRAPERRNPMTTTSFHPTLYAGVTALLGPGSMALHASMTVWGGRLDVLSMYLWVGLVIVYALGRLVPLRPGAFLAAFAALVGALGFTKWRLPIDSDFVFGAMIGVAVAGNAAVRWRRPGMRFESRWLLVALAAFATAFAVWLPSRSGGALCDPQSLVQGHALWHVLCAVAAGAVYLYLRSEDSSRPTGPLETEAAGHGAAR